MELFILYRKQFLVDIDSMNKWGRKLNGFSLKHPVNKGFSLKRCTNKGFSLIEVLVALALFAILGVTANLLLFTSLRGAKKAAAVSIAKAEGAYAIDAMTQMIRFSGSISCLSSTSLRVVRRGTLGTITYSLDTTTTPDRIASVSAVPVATWSLTSPQVSVSSCAGGMFTCSAANDAVRICFVADSASGVSGDVESGGVVTFQTSVSLRNFGN